MNCKTIHNKLIFFLEKELPVSEMKLVQEHLENCSECVLFVEEMRRTFGILEEEKTPELNPYFYTRVKAKLLNHDREVLERRPILTRVLQPAAFSIILLLGVYGGIKLGQPNKSTLTVNTLNEQQMIPYLNEMDAEPIETFLME